MTLDVQIFSLFISFFYGFIFYILLEINYKFLTSSSVFVKVISSLIFILFNTLLYFVILLYINNGYVHVYFFICLLMGYFFCKVLFKWFVIKIRMCYTRFKNSR